MKTVLCHGVFDILHAGHLAYFKAAKKYGDYLVVSITSDRFVNKGPGRPYFSAETRAQMVKALNVVDEVIITDHPTAVRVIEYLKPAFYVKGPDYKDKSKDVTGGIYDEERAVERVGGKLVFTEEPTFSSSAIANRFFSHWTDDQQAIISRVKKAGGEDYIVAMLDKIGALRVDVVGEDIKDTYRFVRPEALSSKSPTISARFQYEESYQGGAEAIMRHLHGFCNPTYITSGVQHEKIRYIDIATNQRLFEVTHIVGERCSDVSSENDLLIVADFGHGRVADIKGNTTALVALNVQTNSSNLGFNLFTRHREFDYLTIDVRELRLAYADKDTPAIELGMLAHQKYQRPLSLTLGPLGSVFFDEGEAHKCPAFADSVVDAIGAGDAYFAITSCLLRLDCDPEIIPFVGNVFAGLKTKILGNKTPVSKASLIKAIRSILK